MNCARIFRTVKINYSFAIRCYPNTLKINTHGILENVSQPLLFSKVRFYAKGKDKNKGKGRGNTEIRDDVMNEVINVNQLRREMQEVIDILKDEYVKNLSLRSAVGSVEQVLVTYEGQEYEIQDLAQISRKNPRMIVLNLASFPQTIPSVLEAIQKSGMNLNPQQDSTSLYIPIPKVTKEHRENLSKNAKSLFNKCKDNIKTVQNKYVRKIDNKNIEGISVEKSRAVQNQIVIVANMYIDIAEKLKDGKQKELEGTD